MHHDKILILDFGSQVTQLIARRIREAHVYCEVHPCDVSNDWLQAQVADGHLKGVVLSGSHASVYEESTDVAPSAVFELGVPVLGICYGMQTMAQQLGGTVEGGQTREFGYAEVRARG
ncbi:MAG: glutamine amidotransferase-related protein, partial [Burkholderiaceae bacterium]